MILTCPRCATRYLADDTQVWSTGRTVQCSGCGQRWRAFGGGVDPQSSPVAGAEGAAAPAAASAPPQPVEAFQSATSRREGPEDRSPDIESPSPGFQPLEAPPPRPAQAPPAQPGAAADDPPAAPALFKTPAPRAARTADDGPPGVRAAQAILLIVLAGVLAVVFRHAIVRQVPALEAVYRAAGVPTVPELGPPHA